MVKQVYQYIGEQLRAMQLFEKIFPYAEIITTSHGLSPVYYVGGGNYQPINLSAFAGCAYLRKNSAIIFQKSSQESLIGSVVNEDAIIGIKLVAAIRKDAITLDQAFDSEIIIEEIFKRLSGRSSAMASCVGVKDAMITIKNGETDREKIIIGEYGSKDISFEWLIVSLDIEVTILFDKNCMTTLCDGYESMTIECLPCINSEIVSPPVQSGADALAIYRDDTQPPSVDISWNSLKIKNLANGTNDGDAVNVSQLNTKADKASPSILNDIATLDAAGNAVDSGKKFDDSGTTTSEILSASKVIERINDAIAGSSVPDATAAVKGIAKLYQTVVGVHSDGSVSQGVIATALGLKEDKIGKNASNGYVGLDLLKLQLLNVLGTFISFLTNANTASRTYLLQDKSGTIAHLDDIVPNWYKECSMTINEDGHNDPIYQVNFNELGAITSFIRDDVGTYTLTFTNDIAASLNDLHIEIHNNIYIKHPITMFTKAIDMKRISILSWSVEDGALTDSGFFNTSLVIRVKN